MKILLVTILFAASAFPQAVTIGIRVGAGAVQTATLSPIQVAALTAFLETQQVCDTATPPVCTPKYAGIAALIIANLNEGLLDSATTAFPSGAIATRKAELATAQAALDAARAAAKATLP